MLREYYRLTKPGIIRGNAITASAGFFLASKGNIDWWLLLAMLCGLSLVIASACVLNNYLDRDIDAKMARTKKRALVTGRVSIPAALVFASILELLGATILGVFTTQAALHAALFGFFFYVVVYGWSKRTTPWSTVIGSLSGSVPPVVGYTAVSGKLDLAAVLLFIILATWQMPHFYAIAIFRMREYAAAKIPVLPIKLGVGVAKRQIIAYVILFIIAASLLTLFDYTGYTYLAVVIVIGAFWLKKCLAGLRASDDTKWARGVFGFSLIVIAAWSVVTALDGWLP